MIFGGNKGLSLHEFRCIVELNHNKPKDDIYFQGQIKMLEAIGINIEFNNNEAIEIREKCTLLGTKGWAISPFWKPNIDKHETWYKTWYGILNKDTFDDNDISTYYIQNDYKLFNQVCAYARFEVSKGDWFLDAELLFREKMYTPCAMLLTAIFEESVRKCPIKSWRNPVTAFFAEAISKQIEEYYNDEKIEPLSRYIDTMLLLPSVDGFIKNYFASGLRFENKVEPNFLERNWLMHGMTNRSVSENDCIKLFNVICSLSYILHTIFQTDYRQ